MPIVLVGIAALFAGGYFIDKFGEGLNDAGTGVVKVALVGGVGYITLKKLKVL